MIPLLFINSLITDQAPIVTFKPATILSIGMNIFLGIYVTGLVGYTTDVKLIIANKMNAITATFSITAAFDLL